MKELTFNPDGTIDPKELEGMPQEFIDRLTSPEFVERARREIRAKMQNHQKTGRRESKRGYVNFQPNAPGMNRKHRRAYKFLDR